MFSKIKNKFKSCGTVLHNCTETHLDSFNWPNLDEKEISFKVNFIENLMKSKYNEPLLQYLNKRSTSAYSTRQKALCDIKLLKGKMTERSFECCGHQDLLINIIYQNKFLCLPIFYLGLASLSLPFLPIPIY